MTVPWTGFPLSQLLKIAEPLASAKYVVFETAQDKVMYGLNAPFYPWPYVEGVTIDEAANDLAFMSTGMYGKPLPPQNGGPIRLTLPWKYGFKSAKALGEDHLHREAPGHVLGVHRALRIRFLGQCEPRRRPSALEPGVGTPAGQRRKGAYEDF